MKFQRHNAIRDLLATTLVTNQDELRRKLHRRGIEVTQATLSRDIHELRLFKGPGGYSLPNRNGGNGADTAVEDNSPPSVAAMIESFGLRVRQAMNQVVVGTGRGGAQLRTSVCNVTSTMQDPECARPVRSGRKARDSVAWFARRSPV